jgi:hypothetical protein
MKRLAYIVVLLLFPCAALAFMGDPPPSPQPAYRGDYQADLSVESALTAAPESGMAWLVKDISVLADYGAQFPSPLRFEAVDEGYVVGEAVYESLDALRGAESVLPMQDDCKVTIHLFDRPRHIGGQDSFVQAYFENTSTATGGKVLVFIHYDAYPDPLGGYSL